MAEVPTHPECPFSVETFKILEQVNKDFDLAQEEKFEKYVKNPLEQLCSQVAAQLPGEIIKSLDKKIDKYPDFKRKEYEIEFYNRGVNFYEINSARLFVNLVSNELRFGLFVVDPTPDKKRFIKSCQDKSTKEIVFQNTHLPENCTLHFSSKGKYLDYANRLGEWLGLLTRQNSRTKNIQASVHLEPNEVLQYSNEQISIQIRQTIEGLFPLFLLATCDKPIPAIRKYLSPWYKVWAEQVLKRGIIKYKEQNYKESIEEFDKSLEEAPNLVEAYSYRGEAKANLEDFDGAISDYNQLLLIQPKNHKGYYNRANAYCQLENYETALDDYNQSLNLNSNFALAYYHRGLCYQKLDKKEKALDDLLRALEIIEHTEEMDNHELIPTIKEHIDLLLPTPKYTLTQCAEDTSREESQLQRWIRTIERKKQAILYGSPGTGKTFIAEKLAQYLITSSNGFSELIQFHPAYSYEDFIQGIRPQSQNGQLTYPLVPGRFIEFCKKAESYPGLCVLIIDEINRANLAQVFGELMYLLEYRDKKIPLAGSSEPFGIPQNVRIIGTMNTADRSIALVDHALRRRFAFIELRPNYQVLRQYHRKTTNLKVDGLIAKLQQVNQAIADKHYELGISFFLTENLAEQIEDIWQMEIEPYLEEYFFDQLDKIDEFRWEKVQSQIYPLHENNSAN